MTAQARLADLLQERGAGTIDHPGGTLFEHLERVQRRLARLGASDALQLAGRAHAVYGTDGFDVRLLADEERAMVVDIVGPDVERLVYRYGSCDRARTWTALVESRCVWDRLTGDGEQLSAAELRDFTDLSIVNELDVAEHALGFLDEHGGFFRRLTGAWASMLSPAVLADARQVFGADPAGGR